MAFGWMKWDMRNGSDHMIYGPFLSEKEALANADEMCSEETSVMIGVFVPTSLINCTAFFTSGADQASNQTKEKQEE